MVRKRSRQNDFTIAPVRKIVLCVWGALRGEGSLVFFLLTVLFFFRLYTCSFIFSIGWILKHCMKLSKTINFLLFFSFLCQRGCFNFSGCLTCLLCRIWWHPPLYGLLFSIFHAQANVPSMNLGPYGNCKGFHNEDPSIWICDSDFSFSFQSAFFLTKYTVSMSCLSWCNKIFLLNPAPINPFFQYFANYLEFTIKPAYLRQLPK